MAHISERKMKINANSIPNILLFLVIIGISNLVYSKEKPNLGQVLIKNYKVAHTKGDVEAAMDLVHWVGVDENVKKSIRTGFERNFKRIIKEIEFVNISKDDILEYEVRGITYRPNLDVIKRMEVHYTPTDNKFDVKSSSYLIGIYEGKYKITTAAPVVK